MSGGAGAAENLEARAFIEDFINPTVDQIVEAGQTDDSSWGSFQLAILRENLGWLDSGLRVGVFELDTDSYRHAQEAVEVFGSARSARRGAITSLLDRAFFESKYSRRANLDQRNATQETELWIDIADPELEPYTPWPKEWLPDWSLAEAQHNFMHDLVCAKEDCSEPLLRQLYMLYFASDSEWSPWQVQLDAASNRRENAIFREFIRKARWPFAESQLTRSFETDDGAAKNADSWPTPADWRSSCPWVEPLGLASANIVRRSTMFRFLAECVEAELRRENLNVYERAEYVALVDRLRGQVREPVARLT